MRSRMSKYEVIKIFEIIIRTIKFKFTIAIMDCNKHSDKTLTRRLATLNQQFEPNSTLAAKMIAIDGQQYKEVIEHSQFSQVS